MIIERKRRGTLGLGRLLVILALPLLLCGRAVFAEGAAAQVPPAAGVTTGAETAHRGFYYAFPAYLYGPHSAAGIQAGYQTKNLQFRLDASFITDFRSDEAVVFTNPSVGVFFTQDFESRLRTYQGMTLGFETGISNTFEGRVYFFTFLAGGEWFVARKCSLFFEAGPGLGFSPKEGAFNGGTAIGGGIKGYF